MGVSRKKSTGARRKELPIGDAVFFSQLKPTAERLDVYGRYFDLVLFRQRVNLHDLRDMAEPKESSVGTLTDRRIPVDPELGEFFLELPEFQAS